jgi:orotate phosphoribosyltransferase-like protein
MAKPNLKQKAIQLRMNGLTYSEILKCIPVAKSTVSLWLREVDLSVPQKQRITKKRIAAQR